MEHNQSPNTLRNLWLISQFELVRLFQTTRGLMSIAAFAMIWYFILRYPILKASQIIGIPGFSESVGEVFGQVGLRNLLDWPVAEFAVFWLFSLFLLPVFSLLITSDQTSSDRFRGTLRFLTLRTSRDSIFFGRFIGQMIIQALLLVGILSGTFIMSIYNNTSQWPDALISALIMGINLIIVLLPFTAMMALFSALVRSSRLAVILAIICWGLLMGLIGYLSYQWHALDVLFYMMPGHQLPDLIQSNDWQTLQHAWLPLLQTAVLLLLGRTVIVRSSL